MNSKTLIHCTLALAFGSAGLLAAEPSSIGTGSVRLPVTFAAPARGFVSMALYDTSGALVRSLLYAEPIEKGQRTVQWDGTTDLGKPAAAGDYRARGIFFTEPPALDYVMKVGKSGNPPYYVKSGKGSWGGNLGGPSSIVSNGKSLILVWSAVEDNQTTGIQQMDADGNIDCATSPSTAGISAWPPPWMTRISILASETLTRKAPKSPSIS